jgi:hypothetical protein
MPAVWFESDLANAVSIVAAALLALVVARRLIIAAAGPDESGGEPRRPGAGALPPPRTCPAADCATPNRPDAIFCRRCGTRLTGGRSGD